MRIQSSKKSTVNIGHLCQRSLLAAAGEPAWGLLQALLSEALGIAPVALEGPSQLAGDRDEVAHRWPGVFSQAVCLESASSQKVPLSLNVYCAEYIGSPEK